MHSSFLKPLFLLLLFGFFFASHFSLIADPSKADAVSQKNVIFLYQQDGSFTRQGAAKPEKPLVPINVPLGSVIQINLYGTEIEWPMSVTIISWYFDREFTDSSSTKWDYFLNQDIQPNLNPSDSSTYPYIQTKTFTFVFQTVQTGETKLHFERRTTDSLDHFHPHGYDNLLFDIHVVESAPSTQD